MRLSSGQAGLPAGVVNLLLETAVLHVQNAVRVALDVRIVRHLQTPAAIRSWT